MGAWSAPVAVEALLCSETMSAFLRPGRAQRSIDLARLALTSALAVCFGATLSGAGGRSQQLPEGLQLVPHPALEDVAAPIREGIERVRSDIDQRLDEGATPPRQLGAALGLLGALYHAHGFPQAALAAYANARLLDPGDRRWAYYSGLLYATEGQDDAAIEAFLAALAAHEDVATLLHLADLRLARDEADEAQRLYTRVLELDDESAAAHFGLGRLAADRRQWSEAVRHFERALELQPEATSVHYPLAQAYRSLGRSDEAERHLALRGPRRVRFQDPLEDQLADIQTLSATRVLFDLAGSRNRVSDLDYLGFALNNFGNMAGAAEAIEGMLDAATKAGEAPAVDLARLHLAVAALYERRGSHERALAHLRTATTLAPDLLQAHVELGHVLARQGLYREALPRYDRALALDPANSAALFGRAAAAAALGNDDRARRDLEALLSTGDTETPDVDLLLARVLERSGEPAAAGAHFQRTLELAPSAEQESEAEAGLGRLARSQGAMADAAAHFQRAASPLPRGPGSAAVMLDLGAALGALDRYDEAATAYESAVAGAPQSEPAHLGLVTALLLARRYAEAKQHLEEARRELPQSTALRHLMARFLAAVPTLELRDGERALALAETLFDERRDAPRAETLALALAQAGRFEEAVRLQRSLLEQAARAGANRTAERLRGNLERYEAGLSCCARDDWTVLLPPLDSSAQPGSR